MKNIKILMYAITALLAIAIVGCSGSKTQMAVENGSSNGASPSLKEYVVATDASYAPFESLTEKNEFVGFDIDIVKAIADKGGFKVRLVNTPWEGMFATLTNGDRDILISAITITEERSKEMDFSEPYFEAKQSIAAGKDSPVIKFEDLKGKKVGVHTGTTGDIVVTDLLGKDSKDVIRFENTPLALKELENGGVEAVVADNGVVNNYVNNNSDKGLMTVEDESFDKEFYGLVVKKGNKELVDMINEGLKKIKADGTYDEIYKKHFGE
ncbi:basic amino acid ABC transporter substrate-binding protein [Cohnella sp.]|uniref:basic amino acid ABC transporter substrate-binding protein n=1 Tax=Cohnella sp. TaxID=1883426 RepID=UPI003562EED5